MSNKPNPIVSLHTALKQGTPLYFRDRRGRAHIADNYPSYFPHTLADFPHEATKGVNQAIKHIDDYLDKKLFEREEPAWSPQREALKTLVKDLKVIGGRIITIEPIIEGFVAAHTNIGSQWRINSHKRNMLDQVPGQLIQIRADLSKLHHTLEEFIKKEDLTVENHELFPASYKRETAAEDNADIYDDIKMEKLEGVERRRQKDAEFFCNRKFALDAAAQDLTNATAMLNNFIATCRRINKVQKDADQGL